MAAMLLLPFEAIFAVLTPMKPAWLLPTVFTGMTVAVTTLVDRRTRSTALTQTAAIGGTAAISAPAVKPASARRVCPDARVDLRTVLLGALAAARCQAQGRGARVEVVAPSGLLLHFQPEMLRPVLQALLCNAIQHAPGGYVFVGAMRADGELRVVIIDDGPQVAEPLTGDARTSLARLLALSDASLLVDHRPGDGTTVMLCLPDAE
jgi:signal transduction histidine kinase